MKNTWSFRLPLIIISALVIATLFLVTDDIPIEELKERYTNASSKFMSIGGMEVHYRDEGQGQPIVLLHGTASSLHTWDAWTEELKNDYRVIRFDLPAFGLTGAHPERNYTVPAYMEVLGQLLEELSVDSIVLVGNSLGGRIAWQYAALHPDKIAQLVLLDASGFPSDKGRPWIFQLARIPILNKIISKITPRAIIEKNVKEVFYDDAKVTEELIDRYYHLALREGNRQAFIDRAQLDLDGDIDLLVKLQMPTLIIWGQYDAWVPSANAQKFKAAIPQAEVYILSESGHVPMEESPKESLQALKNFL